MNTRTCHRTGVVLVLATALAGCGIVALAPDRPPLRGDRHEPSETSELVVLIHSGSLGYKAAWVVQVDGVARAWLPAHPSFTRIPIKPGDHEVTVAFRRRDLPIMVMPLPPTSYEVTTRAQVRCAEHRRCALRVSIDIDRQSPGWIVEARPLGDTEVDEATRELLYIKPDQ